MQLLQQEGQSAEFSYLIYKNSEILSQVYADFSSKLYAERADAKFQEFLKKSEELVVKYADRDEQGNVQTDKEGKLVITEQIAEYKAENEKLIADYKDTLDARQQKIQESMQLLDLACDYRLFVMEIDKFPPKTMPAIVGLFGI